MIHKVAHPRAALIGNPSDGYFGKTIAFVFKNFAARVELTPSEQLQIIPGNRDRLVYTDVRELAHEAQEYGYYGGVRLLKAAVKRFYGHCVAEGIDVGGRNFSIGYSTDIPNRLGLAGSSAIITAAVNAMLEFYDMTMPEHALANLVLSVEKDELNIGAGLQDRVAQAYNCPVYMNFDRNLMDERGYGEYIPFDRSLLPPLYLAYRTDLSEGSEVTHNDLADRYAKGDKDVLDAMQEWAHLTERTWEALQSGNNDISELINRNFDIRQSICKIGEGNRQLVNTARSLGASAKFTGSGGAIIGTYGSDEDFDRLVIGMREIGAEVIRPDVA